MLALSRRSTELWHSLLCHLQQEHLILLQAAFVAYGSAMTRHEQQNVVDDVVYTFSVI